MVENKKAYVATVQLLIIAESDAQAMDAISGILSDYEMEGTLKDWAYLSVGGQLLSPTERYIEENYEEGDFLA